jgi:hypothetical protein
MPDAAGKQGRAGTTIQDAIAVHPADRGETSIPSLRRDGRLQNHHRMRLHVVVQRIADFVCREAVGQFDLCDLTRRVHPRVRAPGDCAGDRCAMVQVRCGRFKHLLHRQSCRLSLPSHKRLAVVFQQEAPARHMAVSKTPVSFQWPRDVRAGRSPHPSLAAQPTGHGSSGALRFRIQSQVGRQRPCQAFRPPRAVPRARP